MNIKEKIIEYGINLGIVMGGFYLVYGKNSTYLNFPVSISIVAIRYMGKLVDGMMEENKAGGTTPYNPLKIPPKKR